MSHGRVLTHETHSFMRLTTETAQKMNVKFNETIKVDINFRPQRKKEDQVNRALVPSRCFPSDSRQS